MSHPDPRPPETPRWQRRPEERPEEILDAALGVFGRCGFAPARLEEVAREAGVSKGTLYRYFASKEDLFRAMVRAKVVTCVVAGEEYVRQYYGSATELLVDLMRRLWETVSRPEVIRIARLVQGELGRFPELARFYYEEVILPSRRLFEQALERGLASGEFRQLAHAATARAIASLLVHSAQSQAFFSVYDPNALDGERLFEGIVDLVLDGVRARPPAVTTD
ncbi:MAG TPA: TetR/AcrR family transcriptional regulator [Gemmatimonadales bacterium]|nr:TetR/AcrR family transcriptional regulator [Gemmatimonadales bacterium]